MFLFQKSCDNQLSGDSFVHNLAMMISQIKVGDFKSFLEKKKSFHKRVAKNLKHHETFFEEFHFKTP